MNERQSALVRYEGVGLDTYFDEFLTGGGPVTVEEVGSFALIYNKDRRIVVPVSRLLMVRIDTEVEEE